MGKRVNTRPDFRYFNAQICIILIPIYIVHKGVGDCTDGLCMLNRCYRLLADLRGPF